MMCHYQDRQREGGPEVTVYAPIDLEKPASMAPQHLLLVLLRHVDM
jgi:hypothetical protein